MRAIHAICEEHGQPPSWWDGLSQDDQALLLAYRNHKLKAAKKANQASKRPSRRRGRRR